MVTQAKVRIITPKINARRVFLPLFISNLLLRSIKKKLTNERIEEL